MGAPRLYVQLLIGFCGVAVCGWLALLSFDFSSIAFFLTIVVTGVVAAAVLTRRMTRPIADLRRMVRELDADRPTVELTPVVPDEFRAVTLALEAAAARSTQKLDALRTQRTELEAVLSSMNEAVIAVDRDRRILNLNPAAEALFHGKIDTLRDRPFELVIRNTLLQKAVADTLEAGTSSEQEILLLGPPERQMYARAMPLTDAHDQPIGALLMLNEITELKRLETIRRDFVANVSHELRTPITSIQGFVETLIDGAMNSPEDARRFLEIIRRQTERLNAIIEDLLSLSAIEEKGAEQRIRFKTEDVRRVVNGAVETCMPRAQERRIVLDVQCPDQLTARMNDTLFEQALVNLIDNAIKYSAAATTVTVRAAAEGGLMLLTVTDQGPGIERVHQERLFERFFRIDKGRARAKGGTGLGLAIVKHIAQVHGGSVAVSSALGQGSTFSITIPLAQSESADGVAA